MKRLLLTLLVLAHLLVLHPDARAQFALNAGESLTYQFDALPLRLFVNETFPGPFGQLSLHYATGSFQAGDSFRVELFETSAAGAPILSMILDNPLGDLTVTGLPDVWQDRQGAIRLTGLTGSVIIQSAEVEAYVPGAGGVPLYIYTGVVPVPEPATWALLILGSMALFTLRRHRRAQI